MTTTTAPSRARNVDPSANGAPAGIAARTADTIADGPAATRDTHPPALTDAAGKTLELQETWLAQAKTVTEQVLDVYEDGLCRSIDYQRSMAAATGVNWVIRLTDGTSRIIGRLASGYPQMVRGFLH